MCSVYEISSVTLGAPYQTTIATDIVQTYDITVT